jgi:hypothetical protein
MKKIAKTMVIMTFLCLQYFEIVRADISNETACYVSSDGKARDGLNSTPTMIRGVNGVVDSSDMSIQRSRYR